MDLFGVLIILIGLFVAGMLAMMLGVAIFVGLAWLALVLIQLALAMLIKAVTGRAPGWLLSAKTFKIEAVIAIVIIFAYYLTPVDSGKLLPDECSSISYSLANDDGGSRSVVRTEQVEDMMALLENYELRRRLNLRFINEAVIMHDNGGLFLYLRDEDGALLKKVRLYGDMFGVADKEDDEFIYYKAGGEINTYPYEQIIYQQGWENNLDIYQEKLDALRESWSYENGTFTAVLPDWGIGDWKLSVDGRVPVLDENGEKEETDYITYLELTGDQGGHAAGEVLQFTLTDAPHEKLTCTVRIDGFSYEYSLLFMVDEEHIWP